MSRRWLARASCMLLLTAAASAKAQSPAEATSESFGTLDRQFVLGIAAGLERFDTNLRIVDRNTGNAVFIDGEGNFGLPESQTVPILYGAWRINEKHGLGFYAFKVNRSGSALSIDQDYGRLEVNGQVTFSDTTSLSYFNYSYTLFDDRRTLIRALLGVYALDLNLQLDAVGEITLDGEPVQSGFYSDNLSQFAPLPLIGLDYWSKVTDKWYLGGKIAFITGSYSDVSALVVEAAIRARYRMTDRMSLITGANLMSADVDIKRTDRVQEISYGFEGIYLGLDFNF